MSGSALFLLLPSSSVGSVHSSTCPAAAAAAALIWRLNVSRLGRDSGLKKITRYEIVGDYGDTFKEAKEAKEKIETETLSGDFVGSNRNCC